MGCHWSLGSHTSEETARRRWTGTNLTTLHESGVHAALVMHISPWYARAWCSTEDTHGYHMHITPGTRAYEARITVVRVRDWLATADGARSSGGTRGERHVRKDEEDEGRVAGRQDSRKQRQGDEAEKSRVHTPLKPVAATAPYFVARASEASSGPWVGGACACAGQALAKWLIHTIPGGCGVRGLKKVCVPKIDLQVRPPLISFVVFCGGWVGGSARIPGPQFDPPPPRYH